jgi:hypothetical protein
MLQQLLGDFLVLVLGQVAATFLIKWILRRVKAPKRDPEDPLRKKDPFGL